MDSENEQIYRPEGSLYKSKILSLPREALGVVEGTEAFEPEYHSIASTIYSIIEHLNDKAHPDYRPSAKQMDQLKVFEARLSRLKDEELKLFEKEGGSPEEIETKKKRHLRIHATLPKFIKYILDQDLARERGQHEHGETKQVAEKVFDARKYVDVDLIIKFPVYAELRSITSKFNSENVVLDKSRTPDTIVGIDELLIKLPGLLAELRAEASFLTAEPEKQNLITGVVIKGLENLQSQLDRLKTDLLQEAERKMSSEITAIPEIDNLQRAISEGKTPYVDPEAIERQSKKISDAIDAIDIGRLASGFDPELQDKARIEIQKIIDTADPVLDLLEKARVAAIDKELSRGIESKKSEIMKIVREILKNDFTEEMLSNTLNFVDNTGSRIVSIEDLLKRIQDLFSEYLGMPNADSSALAAQGYKDAETKLKEMSQEKRRRSPEYREEIWARMRGRLVLTNAGDVQTADHDEILASIDLIISTTPEKTKKLRGYEKKKWNNIFTLWDGYYKGSESNDSGLRALWVDAHESRSKIQSVANYTAEIHDLLGGLQEEDELKELDINEGAREVCNLLESYFQKPQAYTSTGFLREKELLDKGSSTKPEEEEVAFFDYAANGNPEPDEAKDGVKTLMERLKADIKEGKLGLTKKDQNGNEVPMIPSDSIVEAVWHAAMIGEMRFKYFAKPYSRYLASPKNFKADPLLEANPILGTLYGIRAYGKLDTDNLLLWQIIRLPSKSKITESVPVEREVVVDGKTTKVKSYEEREVEQCLLTDVKIELEGDHWDISHPYKVSRDKMNSKGKKEKEIKPEYAPPEAAPKMGGGRWTGDWKKDHPETAVRNQSVADAITVRTLRDQQLTLYDDVFEPVELTEDLSMLPYLWDVVSSSKYTGITYEGYITMCKTWSEFLIEAQKLSELSTPADVVKEVQELGGKLSKFKDIFSRLKGDDLRRLEDIIVQVFLRDAKNIFDRYDEKTDTGLIANVRAKYGGKSFSKRDRVLDLIIEALEGLTTIPGGIRQSVVEKLSSFKADIFTNNLFSNSKGSPFPVFGAEKKRREDLIARMLVPLTATQKEGVKGEKK